MVSEGESERGRAYELTPNSRALAQKLSIRLGHRFVSGLLIEVDSSALLSRWFGESGRLVKQLFDDIAGFAKVESVFVCVIIDEVESLVSRRDPTDGGRDCRDGLRVRVYTRMKLT